MSALNDLISQIENEELRKRIQVEVDRLAKQKKFGLVFEEHMPECTPLFDVAVKRGSLVMLRGGDIKELYYVRSIDGENAVCVKKDGIDEITVSVKDLVCVAEFGEPIYPYLKPIDSICNAPDSDLWHTLIEADNYHALQLLEYLYAGKVDCIYIDPPYNTGARDWKYNNDYVDNNDQYRHSKWLSMMQKRLKLAKKLLNPKDSVLIVTIDEKEYLHLGCLLEEIFPEAQMQMITSMTNKKGSTRQGAFCRRDEYLYILFLGDITISKSNDDMISSEIKSSTAKAIWNSLLRRGADGSSRRENPNLFYPFYISTADNSIVSVGEALPPETERNSIEPIEGTVVGWPIRSDGSEGRWQVSAQNAREMIANGTMKAGRFNPSQGSIAINYLKKGQLNDLANGVLVRTGTDSQGAGVFEYSESSNVQAEPGTIWVRDSHDASIYGSTLLRQFLPGRRFPFPKSLYAVHDTIRFFTSNKPNALIVDFFAGSGTTLHAVNLLNAEDGGKRRCILVTNNEVSDTESKEMAAKGLKPGDTEWEALGIARYVTWPRTVCSIKGENIKGEPLKGNYIGSDIPMADGFKANAAFFKLGFLDKNAVALGRQFKEMLPTLWMKAGAHGKCPEIDSLELNMLVLPENKFAVLVDEKHYMEFVEEIDKHPEIETVFIVTDSEAGYRDMISGFGDKQTYQLYRDYLDNFRINSARR